MKEFVLIAVQNLVQQELNKDFVKSAKYLTKKNKILFIGTLTLV